MEAHDMQLPNHEGRKVPAVVFRTRSGDAWVDVTTDDLFAGKRVVVFSLPGAFTPTCSSSHLPRYNELAPVFKKLGIDSILCVSVNDTFVMNAWKADQEAENIGVIPDGNGEFTAGMGMLVDKNDLGFGKRSWRYSMLVEDGTVKKMFIEPDKPGDPFDAADDRTIGREQVVRRQFIIDDGLSDLGDDALSFTILDGICLLLELGNFPVEVDQ